MGDARSATSLESSAHGRIVSLDGVRGIAAIVVVLHHGLLVIPAMAAPYFGGVVSQPLVWAMTYTPLHAIWAGKEAVDVFFVLSGLVLALAVLRSRRFSWAAYYPSRLIRLYVPVIASVVFALVLAWLIPRGYSAGQSAWISIHEETMSASRASFDALLLGGTSNLNSPLWSLRYEVIFSLLLPVYAVLCVAMRRLWILAAGLLFGITAAGLHFGIEAMIYLPIFALGVLMAVRIDMLTSLSERIQRAALGPLVWWLLFIVAVLGITARWTAEPIVPKSAAGLTNLVTIFAAALFVFLGMYWPKARALLETRPARWLGTISFSLYLIHEPIMVSLAHVLPIQTPWAVLPIGLPLSLGIAAIFHRFIEKPAHRQAQKLSHRIAVQKRRSQELSK